MLAKNYEDYKDKIDFGDIDKGTIKAMGNVFSQPKLDGMRCIVTKDGMFSRNGKRIRGCEHVQDELKNIFTRHPNVAFDGELYNHDYKDDFNTIISNTKKLKPNNEDIENAKEIVQYHIYDFIILDTYKEEKTNYLVRKNGLNYIQGLVGNNKILKFVKTTVVRNQIEVNKLLEQYLTDGYEGQIIRLAEGPYENKRSKFLLKHKVWQDAEFELVDLEPGIGNWAGKAKRAILKLPDGRTFGAGVRGSMEYAEELLKTKDKYIGTMCTVIFANYTPDGVPRFGRIKEFDRRDI